MATVEKITFRCYTDSGIYFYAKTDAPNNEWLWMDENSGGLVSSADELTYQGNYNIQLYKIISIDENSVYYNADFLGGGSNSTATRYSAGDLKTVEEVPEPDPQPQLGGGNLKTYAFLRKDDGFITLIETSTSGTYTIENENDTIAEVVVVGAGGGGVGCAHGSKWYYADGGGGAAFVGTINLPAGTYTVTVGAGGASNFNASSASDAGSVTGGSSSLGDLIIAGGGIRGSGTNCVYPGAGGTLTINADVISSTIQSNGNNAGGGGSSGHGQAQSLYQNYGKGGMGIYGGSVAGTNGYVLVKVKLNSSKIKAYNIMRRYVKHAQGDFNPRNVIIVGNPMITEQGVVSGFSTSNYIRPTAFKPESSPWEMMFKVTTGEDVTTEQCIFGVEDITNQRAGFGMSVHNGFFSIRLMTASSGTSWTFGGDGTIAVQPNTTYKLKASWNGNTYYLQVMEESASTYITDISYTSSSPIYRISNENEDTIGVMMCNSSTIYPFLGSIDLSESYMKVNGEYYWTGFYTENVIGYKAYNIIDPSWESGSQTFNYTGALQTYTVPEGVTSIQVDCVGAKGYTASLEGGLGGRVKCNLSVTPGQTLYVWVANAHSNITTPEYNASDIRTSSADITSTDGLNSRLIVAGGGGDGSQTNFGGGSGGHGGGLIGGSGRNGYGTEATGGTQTAGGIGGTHGAVYGGGSGQGNPGTFGLGGATKAYGAGSGGCGGAGYYGGGGGSMCTVNKVASVNGVGGAGGSSYTDPTLCSNVSHVQGFNDGNGYVKISYKVRRRF